MDFLDGLAKIAGIVIPTVVLIFSVLVWFLRRIERGQAVLLKKIIKIDKHKVSYKVCDQRRAEGLCKSKQE